MPEVWLIRHGESLSNAGAVAVDRSSTTLTETGQEQARRVSLAIPRAPELIVVTPYIRTHQTAQPLRDRYPHVPCETWELHEFSTLSERNYVGTTQVQRNPAMQAFWETNDPHHVDGEGAESFAAFVGRINAGMEKLRARPENFIVVFAHGYTIQAARLMLGKPEASLKELMRDVAHYTQHSPVENGAITRVLVDAAGMRLHDEDTGFLSPG